jgi:hypothetical protein
VDYFLLSVVVILIMNANILTKFLTRCITGVPWAPAPAQPVTTLSKEARGAIKVKTTVKSAAEESGAPTIEHVMISDGKFYLVKNDVMNSEK